jgi:hypothetical protein
MATTYTNLYNIWSQFDGFPNLDTICDMLLYYTVKELIEYDIMENFVIEEDIDDNDICESDISIFEMADDYDRSFHPRSRSPRSRSRHKPIESDDRLIAVGRVVNGKIVGDTY